MPSRQPVVLISDALSPATVAALGDGFDVRRCDGTDRAVLLAAVAEADALMVRSGTRVDAEVLAAAPRLRVVARAGTGLAAISWGLAHERMSIAGQVASSCQRVLGITHARMMRRRQFGVTLFEHQALRMRMADLQARVDLLRHGLHGIAAQGRLDLRAAAAVKVTAARLGDVISLAR